MMTGHHAPAPRLPAPARNPVREKIRRWLMARAMALEPIGDIANATLTENTGTSYPVMVDDYEDNDISEYSGATGTLGTDTDALLGSYAAYTPSGADNVFVYSEDGDGLNYYPAAGDKVAVYSKDNSGSDFPTVFFALNDTGSGVTGYSWFLSANSDELELRRHDGMTGADISTSRTTLADDTSPTVNYDTWYEIEWHWLTDGTISGKAYEVDQTDGTRGTEIASVSTTDSNYVGDTGVGFGVQAGDAGGGTIFDHYRQTGEV